MLSPCAATVCGQHDFCKMMNTGSRCLGNYMHDEKLLGEDLSVCSSNHKKRTRRMKKPTTDAAQRQQRCSQHAGGLRKPKNSSRAGAPEDERELHDHEHEHDKDYKDRFDSSRTSEDEESEGTPSTRTPVSEPLCSRSPRGRKWKEDEELESVLLSSLSRTNCSVPPSQTGRPTGATDHGLTKNDSKANYRPLSKISGTSSASTTCLSGTTSQVGSSLCNPISCSSSSSSSCDETDLVCLRTSTPPTTAPGNSLGEEGLLLHLLAYDMDILLNETEAEQAGAPPAAVQTHGHNDSDWEQIEIDVEQRKRRPEGRAGAARGGRARSQSFDAGSSAAAEDWRDQFECSLKLNRGSDSDTLFFAHPDPTSPGASADSMNFLEDEAAKIDVEGSDHEIFFDWTPIRSTADGCARAFGERSHHNRPLGPQGEEDLPPRGMQSDVEKTVPEQPRTTSSAFPFDELQLNKDGLQELPIPALPEDLGAGYFFYDDDDDDDQFEPLVSGPEEDLCDGEFEDFAYSHPHSSPATAAGANEDDSALDDFFLSPKNDEKAAGQNSALTLGPRAGTARRGRARARSDSFHERHRPLKPQGPEDAEVVASATNRRLGARTAPAWPTRPNTADFRPLPLPETVFPKHSLHFPIGQTRHVANRRMRSGVSEHPLQSIPEDEEVVLQAGLAVSETETSSALPLPFQDQDDDDDAFHEEPEKAGGGGQVPVLMDFDFDVVQEEEKNPRATCFGASVPLQAVLATKECNEDQADAGGASVSKQVQQEVLRGRDEENNNRVPISSKAAMPNGNANAAELRSGPSGSSSSTPSQFASRYPASPRKGGQHEDSGGVQEDGGDADSNRKRGSHHQHPHAAASFNHAETTQHFKISMLFAQVVVTLLFSGTLFLVIWANRMDTLLVEQWLRDCFHYPGVGALFDGAPQRRGHGEARPPRPASSPRPPLLASTSLLQSQSLEPGDDFQQKPLKLSFLIYTQAAFVGASSDLFTEDNGAKAWRDFARLQEVHPLGNAPKDFLAFTHEQAREIIFNSKALQQIGFPFALVQLAVLAVLVFGLLTIMCMARVQERDVADVGDSNTEEVLPANFVELDDDGEDDFEDYTIENNDFEHPEGASAASAKLLPKLNRAGARSYDQQTRALSWRKFLQEKNLPTFWLCASVAAGLIVVAVCVVVRIIVGTILLNNVEETLQKHIFEENYPLLATGPLPLLGAREGGAGGQGHETTRAPARRQSRLTTPGGIWALESGFIVLALAASALITWSYSRLPRPAVPGRRWVQRQRVVEEV